MQGVKAMVRGMHYRVFERVEKVEFSELLRYQAERVFGDKLKAATWLRQPRPHFDGLAALEFVQDEVTCLQAKEFLDRLEHGFTC